jgi:hypothetical protein
MHDSSGCAVCQGGTGGSMTDEEFDAFVETCRNELRSKQAEFAKDIPASGKWSYDLETGSLEVGAKSYAMTVIGSYSDEHESWLWGWANEDFPEEARRNAEALKALFDVTGFEVFVEAGIEATRDDAEIFAAVAIHHVDGIGLFKCPGGEGLATLYLAVAKLKDGG